MVPTGRRDFQRPPPSRLSSDVGHIWNRKRAHTAQRFKPHTFAVMVRSLIRLARLLPGVDDDACIRAQVDQKVADVVVAANLYTRNEPGFFIVGSRNHNAFDSQFARLKHRRQRPGEWPQRTIQPELPYIGGASRGRDVPICCHGGDQDRNVEAGAFLG